MYSVNCKHSVTLEMNHSNTSFPLVSPWVQVFYKYFLFDILSLPTMVFVYFYSTLNLILVNSINVELIFCQGGNEKR